MDRPTLKRYLREKTGCTIQHTGWCCGTCFFAISKSLTNEDWQTLLWFRGDYKVKDLSNIPDAKGREKSIQKITRLCKNE